MRKMKALNVKMETLTLMGKDGYNLTHCVCVKCMKLIAKYFFLEDVLVLGVILRVVLQLGKYVFDITE
jgi:hypothetical protein